MSVFHGFVEVLSVCKKVFFSRWLNREFEAVQAGLVKRVTILFLFLLRNFIKNHVVKLFTGRYKSKNIVCHPC